MSERKPLLENSRNDAHTRLRRLSSTAGGRSPAKLAFQNLHYTIDVTHKKKKSSPSPANVNGHSKTLYNDPSLVRLSEPTKPAVSSVEPTQKRILRNVSGCATPGNLHAILGSSGAGKTTLLDCLAGRKNTGRLEGNILINGYPRNNNFNRICAYVMQDDALLGNLTVYETLYFSVCLRACSLSKAEREIKVRGIIADLGLERVTHSYVGDNMRRGLSGGEKKRVSIGVQLLVDPAILFLDEPTTGLDAYNSLVVMQKLKDIARDGNRTIIASVHQPRGRIFDLFDHVMFLSRGELIYSGAADAAVQAFTDLGYPCPIHSNPADYFIDLIVSKESEEAVGETSSSTDLSLHDMALKNYEKNEEIVRKAAAVKGSDLQEMVDLRQADFLTQTLWVTWREFLNAKRQPLTTFVMLGQTIFMALLVGATYYGLTPEQRGIQDRLGLLFFICINQVFSLMPSLAIFIEQRVTFSRERAAGMYSTLPYFFAKTIVDLPTLLFFPMVFSAIVYWLTGLQNSAYHFGIFYLTLVLVTNVTSGLFVAFGCISPNLNIAQILAPVTLVLFVLYSGFYINSQSLLPWLDWIAYVSFIKYAWQTLVINEFTDLTLKCNDVPAGACIAHGKDELRLLGMENGKIAEDFFILLGMTAGYRILAYLALRFTHWEKR
eukprot:m.206300 g.206300  ORF g.206300 m.206300 type:complete len:662 (-) comp26059_c0_seq10:69-2054(-)